MNNILKQVLAVSLISLATSCGGGDTNTLEGKQAKIVELKKQLVTLQSEIAKLEKDVKNAGGQEQVVLKRITTEQLSKQNFEHFIEVQGNVDTDENILVNPEINGPVLNVRVSKGDYVNAGQVLATIEVESIQKNIDELNTRLNLAKEVLSRQENLWNQKIGTEIQVIQARNNVEALEKSIATVKSQTAKGVVNAPISGVVDEIFVQKGEMANPMAPMMRIINVETVTVEAEVSETFMQKVKKGDEVTVSFPVLNKEVKQTVKYIGQFIEPGNRTFKLSLELPNADGSLRPNVIAIVKIKDFTRENSVSVPTNVILQTAEGQKYLYVASVNGEKAVTKKVMVKTGISYDGRTLIEEGLTGEETIVVKGYNEVVEGEEVVVVKE